MTSGHFADLTGVVQHDAPMRSGSRDAAADYYRSLTSLYRWYGTTAHGWHYGIYDGKVNGHGASLRRSNECLVDGLPSTSRSLLDVGCGEGGFAAWAAGRGYDVIGITLCTEHVQLARALAASQGLRRRTRFLVADMDELPFASATVDVVVNQETWCHSQAKYEYLRGVHRVLRPGGFFRSVDLCLGRDIASAREERQYQAVLDGFQLPSLLSAAGTQDSLAAAGFGNVSIRDLTANVRRSALLILGFSAAPHLLASLRLGFLLYGRDARIAEHYRRHVAACMAFNRGLLTGLFRYVFASAQKPA